MFNLNKPDFYHSNSKPKLQKQKSKQEIHNNPIGNVHRLYVETISKCAAKEQIKRSVYMNT